MAKINFTPDALEDMKEIKAYITDELCSEQSAINTTQKIMKRIRQLTDFPEIGADEELQLWLVVQSENAGLLDSCGGGWYFENGEWMLITG